MKKEDAKKGMRVRISKNIGKTEKRFTASDVMYRMRGKTYTIHSADSDRCVFMIDGARWVFCYEDVEEAPATPPPPPVTFDPANLSTS